MGTLIHRNRDLKRVVPGEQEVNWEHPYFNGATKGLVIVGGAPHTYLMDGSTFETTILESGGTSSRPDLLSGAYGYKIASNTVDYRLGLYIDPYPGTALVYDGQVVTKKVASTQYHGYMNFHGAGVQFGSGGNPSSSSRRSYTWNRGKCVILLPHRYTNNLPTVYCDGAKRVVSLSSGTASQYSTPASDVYMRTVSEGAQLAAFIDVRVDESIIAEVSANPLTLLKARKKYWVLPEASAVTTVLQPISATEASSGPSASKVESLTQSTETTTVNVVEGLTSTVLNKIPETSSVADHSYNKSSNLNASTESSTLSQATASKLDSLTSIVETTSVSPVLSVYTTQLGTIPQFSEVKDVSSRKSSSVLSLVGVGELNTVSVFKPSTLANLTEVVSLGSITASKSNTLANGLETSSISPTSVSKLETVTTLLELTSFRDVTSSISNSLTSLSENSNLNLVDSSKSGSLVNITEVSTLGSTNLSKVSSLTAIAEVTSLLSSNNFKDQVLSKTTEVSTLNNVTDADTILLGKCATSGIISPISSSKLSTLAALVEDTLLTNLSRLYTLTGVSSTESATPVEFSKLEVLLPTIEITSLLNVIISGSNTLGTINALEGNNDLSYTKVTALSTIAEVGTLSALTSISNFKVAETSSLANLTSYRVYQLGNSIVELVTLGSVTTESDIPTDQYIIIDGEVIVERNVTKYVTDNTPKTRVIVQGGGNRVVTHPSSSRVIVTDNSTKIGVNSGYNLSTTIKLSGENVIMYRKIIDVVEGTAHTYIGEASPGEITSAAAWRIKRITIDNVTEDTYESWAAGNANFDKVWDARATETYL